MATETELYTKIIDLIIERTGLSTHTQRRADVINLLQRFSGEDLPAYMEKLQTSDDTATCWQDLIHALTVGETYFLRDKRHFSILRENLLPELVAQRRKLNRKEIRVWSAGCATGEEAYSMAITLREFIPDIDTWTITIVGSDINQRAINAAKKGIYRQWSFRHTPENFRTKYFTMDEEDQYRLNDDIREMVIFQRTNLLRGFPQQSCDIALCRNVLMYLAEEQAIAAEQVLYDALAPGGSLLLGQAEALHGGRDRWIMHIYPGTPIYQKPETIFPKQTYRVHIEDKADPTPVMAPIKIKSTYQDAVQSLREDDTQEAELHLAAVLTDQPSNPHAHTLMAYIFANRKALPEAQAHLNAALKDDPLLADAHYIRALIASEEGDTVGAMAALQAVLYSERKHALAAYTLGNLYARDGETKRARKAWENAMRALDDANDEAYISNLSNMTVVALKRLLANSLEGSAE